MSAKLAGRNLVFYLFNYGTKFLSPVLVMPILAKTFGPSVFSDYVLWNAVVWTSVLLMEFGFYLYGINAVASADSSEKLSRIVSGILSAKLMLAPLAIIVFLTSAIAIGLATRQPLAVGLGVFATIAYGMNLSWYLQGLQRGATAVLIEAVPQFLQLLLVLLLVHAPDQMWRVAGLQTAGAVVTTTLGWLLTRHQNVRALWRPAIDSIRDAFPYFVDRIAFTLYSTATPIIISVLSTAHQAAFYGLAEKVNTVLTALVFAATPAISPLVTRHARRTPPDWSLSIKVVLGITVATIVAASAVWLAIGPLMQRYLGEEFADAVPLARLFCLVASLMAFQLSLSNFILLPNGQAALLVHTSIVALLISFSLQVLLVPGYGALASVIARACSELAVGTILLFVAIRVVRNRKLVSDAADR